MKLLPLLLLCGCAALKPLPQQTLDCTKAEANASNAVKAAMCIAQGATTSAIESCYLDLAEGAGLDLLECEGLAIWSDISHAAKVGNANAVAASTVQANAQVYLLAKGVIVRTPSHP